MTDFLGVANNIEKLNSNNYENCCIRIHYYLIGQDLWDIVGGESTTPPTGDAKARMEWEMKCGRTMFVLMVAVEDEQMQRIRSAKIPKEAWRRCGKFRRPLSPRRTKQSCSAWRMSYSPSRNGSLLMRRIIIYGLRPEFTGLVTATRGWATQPTLDELENILSNEETLDNKMSKVAVKDYEEEALFNGNRGRSARNDHWRRRVEGDREYRSTRDEGDRDYRRKGEDGDEEERRSQLGGAQRRDGRSSESQRRFDGMCYNCGKKGHIARYCRSENKPVESHAMITSGASPEEEEWDMEALAVLSDGELESQGSAVIEEKDWNFDNSMLITEDEEGNIIEETWGEANGEIKLELLEVEEEIDEQCVELPET
ncbi:uncharacterized protein LOC125215610 [Salvia hispanica]|uniref:uncharacterized protein LOC125215610 n=1 Tax=Salvia hispanica TaxID=49212 RepID=UPI0020098E23|nr:uncharacterized protein LOC125215610 [Salvia hispanica]